MEKEETDEGGEDVEQAAHLRLRPIEQLIGGGAEHGGEAVTGEDREGGAAEVEEEGVVVYEPIPAAAQGPRPRRRPPREQWVLQQDHHPQPQQQVAPQEVLQEPEEEQRHQTGSGRLTRPPDFFGVEKGREGTEVSPRLSSSMLSAEREESYQSSTPAASCSPTPPGSVVTTPISTPATSPDTSAVAAPQDISWLLRPMPCSLTAAERAQDPTQRHRHWSFTGAGVYPNHPRFLNWFGEWDPGPRTRRSSAEL